jgi:hypothetical protein
MTCGIYILRFNGTDKVYVGQGLDIEDRYKSHIRYLRKGTASVKMLEAYKLYGFPYQELLVECLEEELNANENEAIAIFNAVDNGFNTLYTAEDMPAWKSELKGEDCGMSVYSNDKILEAAKLMTDATLSLVKVSEITSVKVTTLRKISQGAQHRWISEKYPDIWNKIQAIKETRNKLTHAGHGDIVRDMFTAKTQGIVYPQVISPTGEIYTIDNLSEFCRVHELEKTNFRNVLHGNRFKHKGWKVYKT